MTFIHRILVSLVALLFTAAPVVLAADEHSGHGGHSGHTMPAMDHSSHAKPAMDHSSHGGGMEHKMASPEEVQKRMMRWMPTAEAKVGSKLDPKLSFIDGDGKKRTLGEFFDKPLLVTFIFATCPHICPTITGNLATRIKAAQSAGKGDFRTLVISFDTVTDTAEGMKSYAAGFIDDPSFIGGVGEADTIKALTDAFGYSYMPHPTETWAHITMVSAVDKGGVITRQIFGTKVPADEFNDTLDGLMSHHGK